MAESSPTEAGPSRQPAMAIPTSEDGDTVPGYRQRAESLGQLPKLGTSDDVQAAVQKLERIQRLKDSKRRWRKGTGVAVLTAPTPLLPSSKSSPPRHSHDSARSPEGGRTPMSEKDAGDTASITSRTGRLGEVKLAIGSMPGLTSVVSRARRRRASSDLAPSSGPNNGADAEEESVPSSSIYGSLAAADPSRMPASRRNSGTIDRKSLDKALQPLAQTSTPGDKSPRFLGGPGVSPIVTGLGQVKEEDTLDSAGSHNVKGKASQQEASEDKTIDNVSGDTIFRPVPQRARPRLMIQSPTEAGEAFDIVQSPQSYAPPDNVLSGHRTLNDVKQSGFLAAENLQQEGSSRSDSTTPSRTPETEQNIQAVIEACERNVSRPSLFVNDNTYGDDALQSSVHSPSSESSGSGSESDVSDLSSGEEQQISSLNLEHGSEMTPRERRKLLKRINRDKRRFLRRGTKTLDEQRDNVEMPNADTVTVKRPHRRTGSIGNRVASGLQYATSQSRNRRAMTKYSPHPSRPTSARPELAAGLTMTKTQSDASSPRSLRSDFGMTSLTGASMLAHSSSVDQAQDMASDSRADAETSADDTAPSSAVQRRDTDASFMSISGPSSRRRKLKERIFSLRKARRGPSDVLEEGETSDHTSAEEEDEEKALDQALGKLAAEQAPEENHVKYEYDVLYENQRGMLFFGIPKFSSKVLLQWDPSPWTDAQYGNSVYNIANAQLPDPSWEWVHAEWMIDMSGDVDEAGWQYSFTFGRLSMPFFVRPQQAIPRANARGNAITNERFNKEMSRSQKIQEKREHRADDGIEALKRSAVARQAKWTSIPTQNSYVRRRRWIRLRVRKPLHHGVVSATPHVQSPLIEMGRVFGNLKSKPRQEKQSATDYDDRQENSPKAVATLDDSDEDDDDLSLSDYEEGSSSPSSASEPEVEANEGGLSGFYPKKTPGRLSNGRDPTELRDGKLQKRRRQHAREYTGTLRELKSLLPSLMERRSGRTRRQRSPDAKAVALWLTEIDARNPFLSWTYIKRRLDDDDVAFATSSIRAREKRFASTIASRKDAVQAMKRHDAATLSQASTTTQSSPMQPMDERYPLTKDALVEINFRRVLRVLKVVKLDRQKLQLWRMWLGIEEVAASTDPIRQEDLIDLGLAASGVTTSSLIRSKEEMAQLAIQRWKQTYSPADPADVWDVLERRLDRILMTFEYQSSRATLLRILLTVHASTHAMHKYRPGSVRLGQEGQATGFPADISPATPLSHDKEDTNGIVAGEEWRAARLPRLEFWSDLMTTAQMLLDGTAAALSFSPSTSRPGSASPYGNKMLGARSPLRSSSRAEDRQTFDNFSALRNQNKTPALSSSPGGQPYIPQALSRSSTPKLPGGALSNAPVPRRFSTTATTSYASPKPNEVGQSSSQTGLDMRSYTMPRGLSPAFEQRTDNPRPIAHSASTASGLGLVNATLHMQQKGDRSPGQQSNRPSPRPSSDADRAFLAELLQLPPARQKDLLVQTSTLLQPLAREARDQERKLDNSSDLALGKRRASSKADVPRRATTPQWAKMTSSSEPGQHDHKINKTSNTQRKPEQDAAHADQAMSLVDRLTQAAELEP